MVAECNTDGVLSLLVIGMPLEIHKHMLGCKQLSHALMCETPHSLRLSSRWHALMCEGPRAEDRSLVALTPQKYTQLHKLGKLKLL